MIALCHVRFCVPLPPPDLKAISYQSLAAVLMEGVNADAAEPVPDAQALPIGILAAHQKAVRTTRGGGDAGVEDGKEAASEEEGEHFPTKVVESHNKAADAEVAGIPRPIHTGMDNRDTDNTRGKPSPPLGTKPCVRVIPGRKQVTLGGRVELWWWAVGRGQRPQPHSGPQL